MTIDRLLDILEDWKKYMHQPQNKLGYPSKSSCIITGGSSANDAFEIMLEESDLSNVLAMDSIIDSLPQKQEAAINSRYLGSVKSKDYEYQLNLALDNLLTIASRRGIV